MTTANGDGDVVKHQTSDRSAWLSQGDVFRSRPIALPEIGEGHLKIDVIEGPVVLLTNDCALDKRGGKGAVPKIERLHFARLQSALAQGADRQRLLRERAWDIDPSQVMYLGEVHDLGESFVDLAEIYGLPASLFDLTFQAVDNKDDLRLSIRSGDDRMASLTPAAVRLMRLKMTKYWTRLVPRDAEG